MEVSEFFIGLLYLFWFSCWLRCCVDCWVCWIGCCDECCYFVCVWFSEYLLKVVVVENCFGGVNVGVVCLVYQFGEGRGFGSVVVGVKGWG